MQNHNDHKQMAGTIEKASNVTPVPSQEHQPRYEERVPVGCSQWITQRTIALHPGIKQRI
jgi:hypothetical protein